MTHDGPTSPMAGIDSLPLDLQAFHQLHRPVYIRWAHTQLGNRADAEEAVDDAFEHLALTWDQVLTKDNPNAWAWQIMKNRCYDYARARGRRSCLAQRAFDTTALEEAVNPIGQLEETLTLYRAIEQLPPRQQDVVLLHYLESYTYDEIAAHLGIAAATARSTARHALQTLRTTLGREERETDEP